MKHPLPENGFTLIEVIVVMAIIAILTGIMVPMMYRVWESSDETLTQSRMNDLRIAMVGDTNLYQNGVRTHFGYTGSFGQLPGTLDRLVTAPGGPYLPAGFDPSNYGKDAWGNDLSYSITLTDTVDAVTRNLAATLTSYGPDGVVSADDLVETILESDVVPVTTLQGNIGITFQSDYTNRRIGVAVDYVTDEGVTKTDSYCDNLSSAMTGSAGFTSQAFTFTTTHNLPIGIVTLKPRLFDNACALVTEGAPLKAATNISGGSLFVNLQIKSAP